jgi:hypothetical protein
MPPGSRWWSACWKGCGVREFGAGRPSATDRALRQPAQRRAAGDRPGLYVAYYSVYEVRLFEADGKPEDPLLAAAGRLQCARAGGAHRHGAWPWLVALGVLLITGSAWGWCGHRAAHSRRDT